MCALQGRHKTDAGYSGRYRGWKRYGRISDHAGRIGRGNHEYGALRTRKERGASGIVHASEFPQRVSGACGGKTLCDGDVPGAFEL